jgi:proteasome alpha subunit
MAESGWIGSGFGNTRYPYYYRPEGRLVLVDSPLEAVSRGSTTIGIKTPTFASISSHIKPTRPLVEPSEIFTIDEHVGARESGYIGDILQLIDEILLAAQKHWLTYESPADIASLAKHLSYICATTLYMPLDLSSFNYNCSNRSDGSSALPSRPRWNILPRSRVCNSSVFRYCS